MAIPFPDNLPQPLYDGRQDTPSQDFFIPDFDYAGDKRRSKAYGKFSLTVKFRFTQQELNDFNAWYYSDLKRGARRFNARWSVLGVFYNYEFGVDVGGQPTLDYVTNGNYIISMKVVLITDIFEIVALNSLNGFCPEIIQCQDDLIDFAKNYVAS